MLVCVAGSSANKQLSWNKVFNSGGSKKKTLVQVLKVLQGVQGGRVSYLSHPSVWPVASSALKRQWVPRVILPKPRW